jgi:hypothetical protein
MSSQKSENRMKMGMSLQLIQKPTLPKCLETYETCTECLKTNTVEKFPRGFYCPAGKWKVSDQLVSEITRSERKTLEDHFCL